MIAKDSQKLKGLEVRLTKLEVELDQANEDSNTANNHRIATRTKYLHLLNEIDTLKSKNKDIIISEHAIIRYFERVMGLDLEDLKAEILNDSVKAQINALGDGKYPIGDGVRIVVKDRTIVSVV